MSGTADSNYLFSFVHSAKLIGVASSGLLSGYLFSASTSTVPALLTARVPADKLARVWNDQYAQAWSLARPSIWVASFAFAFASYQRYTNTPALTNATNAVRRSNVFVHYTGLSEVVQLAIASSLVISVVPITTFFLEPTYNKRLELAAMSMEASRSKETSTVKVAILDEYAVKEDVKGWAYVNSVRAAVLGAGFFVGLLSL
ncbi:hypothetical protein FRB97_009730 [Tulasnella sp. 331]|nr:hypothetical protein FRB97_009730 [Tulasnella sp. 331]